MIALACDHGGFALKSVIADYLRAHGIEYIDLGAYGGERCDYPDLADKAADTVTRGEAALGILVCGTGIGMSIAANKTPGIRAALCGDVFSAKMARAHNDANILCLGERVIGVGVALEIVKAFLETAPEDGRHAARRAKIKEREQMNGRK
jgi:ribose 5-phosphate isomerase B